MPFAPVLAAIPYRTLPEVDLGPVTLHTFGVAAAVGALLGLAVLVAHGRRRGLDADALGALGGRLLVAAFVGSRLAYVAAHLGDFAARPWAVVAVWEGGLHFFGGFVAGLVVLVAWLRRHRRFPPLVVADGLSLGLTAGMAVGRLGCVAVGEHLGGPTRFPLATRYLGGETVEGPLEAGVAVHNTALYEVSGLVALFAVLALLAHRRPAPGTLVAVFALWYGVQRFTTDFLRVYDERVGGLTAAQYASLAVVAGGLLLTRRLAHRRPGPVSP